MDGKKIVLITGANTGLGYQIVRALCASDSAYEVLLGGRSLTKAQRAVEALNSEFPTTRSHVQAIQVDIADDTSIVSAFKLVEEGFGRLDMLVNNAGVQLDQQLAAGTMTMRQMWNETYDVNVTGTQIMTATFAPLLLKSDDPRLVFIASGTSSLAMTENPSLLVNKAASKGWPKTVFPANVPAYRTSKTGLNMMMREWCRIFKEDGVKVWGVSPGYLATSLGGSQEVNKRQGAINPEIGGQFVKDVLEGRKDSDIGKVISRQGVQPW